MRFLLPFDRKSFISCGRYPAPGTILGSGNASRPCRPRSPLSRSLTMPRSFLRLTLAFSLLVATASMATAAPASVSGHGTAIRVVLGQLFPSWLGRIGCSYDPNGCNQKPVNKNGCSYDPNGQC